jgi:adenine-specific DNA methylase
MKKMSFDEKLELLNNLEERKENIMGSVVSRGNKYEMRTFEFITKKIDVLKKEIELEQELAQEKNVEENSSYKLMNAN